MEWNGLAFALAGVGPKQVQLLESEAKLLHYGVDLLPPDTRKTPNKPAHSSDDYR